MEFKETIDISYYKKKSSVETTITLTLNQLKNIKSILDSKYNKDTESYNFDILTEDEYFLLGEFTFINSSAYYKNKEGTNLNFFRNLSFSPSLRVLLVNFGIVFL